MPREGVHTAHQDTCQLAIEQKLPNKESHAGQQNKLSRTCLWVFLPRPIHNSSKRDYKCVNAWTGDLGFSNIIRGASRHPFLICTIRSFPSEHTLVPADLKTLWGSMSGVLCSLRTSSLNSVTARLFSAALGFSLQMFLLHSHVCICILPPVQLSSHEELC